VGDEETGGVVFGFGYVSYPTSTGQVESRVAVVTCPECSFLKNGDCVVCVDGEDHPACKGCSDGQVVWYRRPLFVSVATAVVVSIIAGITVHQIEKHSSVLRRLRS
jgi:hypothetical protein